MGNCQDELAKLWIFLNLILYDNEVLEAKLRYVTNHLSAKQRQSIAAELDDAITSDKDKANQILVKRTEQIMASLQLSPANLMSLQNELLEEMKRVCNGDTTTATTRFALA
jgi:hypothetical protein